MPYVSFDIRPGGIAMYRAHGSSRSTVRRIVEGRARNDSVYPIGFTSIDRSSTGSGSMPLAYPTDTTGTPVPSVQRLVPSLPPPKHHTRVVPTQPHVVRKRHPHRR